MTVDEHREIAFTPPMECLSVTNLPDTSDWVYELKLDGYRGQAIRDGRGVRLLSRRGKDFSRKFPGVFRALKDAHLPGTAVDGELVAFDSTGTLSFNALQNADEDTKLVFFAFDLLTYTGQAQARREFPFSCVDGFKSRPPYQVRVLERR